MGEPTAEAAAPELGRLAVGEIAAAVRAGRASAFSVAERSLARIEAYAAIQPAVWIERVAPERVRARAQAVDAAVAAGQDLPLAGVPFAVKDNLDVAGLPTTAACPAYAYVPERSATVVERLEAAGAVLMGKTNLDQFATGLVGVRSPYGIPACVYDRAYVSGGSSSGSAVATAAGLVAFALGTDTAGSGRVPAAFNGLVGLKPTKGRWSTRGLVPACRTLDCVTVFTSDSADAARIDDVLAAFDDEDAYSRRQPAAEPGPEPAAFAFGVAKPGQLDWFGDVQSEALYRQAVRRLEAAGGRPVEIDAAPLLEAAKLLYQGPWVAERTAALEPMLRSNPAAIHPVVESIVQRGALLSAVDAFKGQYALAAHAREAERIWAQVDCLLLPTTPTIYRIADVLAQPVVLNSRLGAYTNFANLLDMSVVAVPAGFRDNGTGFGVSLIGPAWTDRRLLDLAGRYEAAEPLARPALDLSLGKPGVKLAVVGAHLAGMPLHWQLTSRDARFVRRTRTAPSYRLYAMAGTTPPKPALMFEEGGASIEVEVYELDEAAFGAFTAEVPAPLAIGGVTLEDGSSVKGFVAEPRAAIGARDVTEFGGWRAYIAQAAQA